MNEIIIKKKKKGFTLIELIAVIAILAILGAILVPKITGYSDSAKVSKAIADSKIIVNAVAANNASNETDATLQVLDTASFSTKGDTGVTITTAIIPSVIATRPTEFGDGILVSTLKDIATNGKSSLKITSTGVVSNTDRTGN